MWDFPCCVGMLTELVDLPWAQFKTRETFSKCLDLLKCVYALRQRREIDMESKSDCDWIALSSMSLPPFTVLLIVGGTLHTRLTRRSRSGLTMPMSGDSVGTYQETSSHATCKARWAAGPPFSPNPHQRRKSQEKGGIFIVVYPLPVFYNRRPLQTRDFIRYLCSSDLLPYWIKT